MYDHYDYEDVDNDGFFDSYSEFDEKVDEFKQSLMQSVKQEFLIEMENLRRENEELQEVKKNFKGVVQQYENKKRELDNEYNDLKRKVRSERLYTLLESEHKMIMYRASGDKVMSDKCNECDQYRQIAFKTPLGRMAKEDCKCKVGKMVYTPMEQIRYEFRLSSHGNEITAFYRPYSSTDEGLVFDFDSNHADKVYKEGMKFEDINMYRTYFKTEEECQKYCDYLTEKENNK